MRLFLRRLALLSLAALVLAACGTLPSSQAPQEPGAEAPTQQAVPHQWEARPVLISLYMGPGYTDPGYAWSLMPELVVYADGTVAVTRYDYTGQGTTRSVQQTKVSRGEICALLYQLEGHGFFEFTQQKYEELQEQSRIMVSDAGTTYIDVAAWRSNAIGAYAIHTYAIGDSALAEAAPLAESYHLLSSYAPAGLAPYVPTRVGLLVGESRIDQAAPLWPLEGISLKELAKGRDEHDSVEVVLEGQQAADVYALLEHEWVTTYAQGDTTYSLAMRPLLPLEDWKGEPGWGRFPEFETIPTTPFSCGAGAEAPLTSTATPEARRDPLAIPTPTPADIEAPLELVEAIGDRGAPGQFAFTSAVAVSPQGEVLAADSANERLQVFSLEGELLRTLPLTSSYTSDMLVLPDGTLLAADGMDNELELRAPDGVLRRTISGWPAPEENDVSIDDDVAFVATTPDGGYYLAEHSGKRVVTLNADGSLREIWHGPADKPLAEISGLASDAAGTLYVLTRDAGRILRRDAAGQVTELSAASPQGIALRPDGSFYVASWDAVVLHDAQGKVVARWQDLKTAPVKDLALAPDGSVVVLAGESYLEEQRASIGRYDESGQHLASFGTLGLLPGQFDWHEAFAVSPAGDVWLIDTSDDDGGATIRKLVHLAADGAHLHTFDEIDEQPLACDSYVLGALSGQRLLLGDPCAGTVARLDAEGKVEARWGERGSGPGQLNLIADMAIAADEQSLYLLDAGQRAVVRLGLDGAELERWTAEELGASAPVALAVARDGTFFLFDDDVGQVVVRPARGERRAWPLPDPEASGYRLAADAQRGRVYVGANDYLYVFDWEGAYLGRTPNSGPLGVMVQLGPGGKVYAAAGFQSIGVYQPE